MAGCFRLSSRRCRWKNHDGVLTRAEFVEFIENGGNVAIQCLDHRGIGALRFVRDLRVHVRKVGILRLKRRVDEAKRHIAEGRFAFTVADKIDGVLRNEVLGIAFVLLSILAIAVRLEALGDGRLDLLQLSAPVRSGHKFTVTVLAVSAVLLLPDQ